MTEHVEEVVTVDDLKEGDWVRVSFSGTVDAEGDLRTTDAGGYLFRYTMREAGASVTRLTPIPVLPTKRNALIERNGCVYRLSAITSRDGVNLWVSVRGYEYDAETLASGPFRIIFAGEDDQ